MEEEVTGQREGMEGTLVEAGILLLWRIPSRGPQDRLKNQNPGAGPSGLWPACRSTGFLGRLHCYRQPVKLGRAPCLGCHLFEGAV